MDYQSLSSFAQTGGTTYFVVIFLAAVIYAIWPRNGERFRRAAELPMKEKEHGDDRPLA